MKPNRMLYPCKVCGCSDLSVTSTWDAGSPKHEVCCPECGTETLSYATSEQVAIDMWNDECGEELKKAPNSIPIDLCGNCGHTAKISFSDDRVSVEVSCNFCDRSTWYYRIDQEGELRAIFTWNSYQDFCDGDSLVKKDDTGTRVDFRAEDWTDLQTGRFLSFKREFSSNKSDVLVKESQKAEEFSVGPMLGMFEKNVADKFAFTKTKFDGVYITLDDIIDMLRDLKRDEKALSRYLDVLQAKNEDLTLSLASRVCFLEDEANLPESQKPDVKLSVKEYTALYAHAFASGALVTLIIYLVVSSFVQ